MTRERSDLDLGVVLGTWMNDAAPASIPVVVLEEAFARTMASPQVSGLSMAAAGRRSSHPRRLTLLSIAATAALLVGVLAFGALGGGFGIGPAPEPDSVADGETLTDPDPILPIPPDPIAVAIPRDPIVPTASVAVLTPQSLATDGNALWLLTATGSVARIDPATNTAGASIQTGGTTDLYNGISVDANGVWVTDWDATTLFRIDPTTSKVDRDRGGLPKGVLATGSAVWVAGTHDGKVFGSTRRRTKSSPRSRSGRRAIPVRTGWEAGSAASGSASRTPRRSSGSTRSPTRSRPRSRCRSR